MSKYYYTDPLAAAWMAKHFKMGFEGYDHYADWAVVIEAHRLGKRERFYIHPDSLQILGPQKGDIGLVDTSPFFWAKPINLDKEIWCSWGNADYCPNLLEEYYSQVKIIQRRGVFFMWPETENE